MRHVLCVRASVLACMHVRCGAIVRPCANTSITHATANTYLCPCSSIPSSAYHAATSPYPESLCSSVHVDGCPKLTSACAPPRRHADSGIRANSIARMRCWCATAPQQLEIREETVCIIYSFVARNDPRRLEGAAAKERMPADPKLKQKMGVALGTAALTYAYMHYVLVQNLDSHTYVSILTSHGPASRRRMFCVSADGRVHSYLSCVACADLATPRAAVLHTS